MKSSNKQQAIAHHMAVLENLRRQDLEAISLRMTELRKCPCRACIAEQDMLSERAASHRAASMPGAEVYVSVPIAAVPLPFLRLLNLALENVKTDTNPLGLIDGERFANIITKCGVPAGSLYACAELSEDHINAIINTVQSVLDAY